MTTIHDKARVFLTHGRAADGKSFEPQIVDELGRRDAFRTLKGAAGTPFGGLCLAAFSLIFFHRLGNGFLISCHQFHFDRRNRFRPLHETAVTIRIRQLGHFIRMRNARLIQCRDTADNLRHISAESARIHIGRAADCARDPGRKFQSGKSRLIRYARDSGRRGPGERRDFISGNFYTAKPIHRDDDAANAAVSHQEIRPAAQHNIRHTGSGKRLYKRSELLYRLRQKEPIRRAADAHRRVPRHRLIASNPLRGKDGRHHCLDIRHHWSGTPAFFISANT